MNPRTGVRLEPGFASADAAQVDAAAKNAAEAFGVLRAATGKQRAALLQAIGRRIMDLGDELIAVCTAETGLPEGRIVGERGRTVGQLGMFAKLVEEGSWVDARIDRAQPGRQPVPKPDLRRMLQGIGPVVVFGASNFPLAFSVAGGDTASALAAGNPVIVKAHGSHPGTSALVARAVNAAVAEMGLPAGVFSVVHGPGRVVGAALVGHPLVRAVGFTGSHAAGRQLMDMAAAREVPIPVYAEMGSVNPVVLFPQALSRRGNDIARGLGASVCLGMGQFCTNPGLVFLIEPSAEKAESFLQELAQAMRSAGEGVMLNASIARTFHEGVARAEGVAGVRRLLHGCGKPLSPAGGEGGVAAAAGPVLLATDAECFLGNPPLAEEMFGPATLVVRCSDAAQASRCIERLGGNLTATLHLENEEWAQAQGLIRLLERTVGRVVFNGFPTGVEVCAAMNHGGPYPASASPFHTSVGTAAILRFARPVAYQNAPQALLPAELQDANPLNILRLVDDVPTRAAL
jgi:NADP-dependent aldehyde dehydrogenase